MEGKGVQFVGFDCMYVFAVRNGERARVEERDKKAAIEGREA